MNLTKQFFKYVSQNIFGLLGTSCYILADTYFISQAAGTDGVTLLNLCLPVYNFIFAVGSMVGLGAAMIGYLLAPVNPLFRLVFFVGGLMLIDPGLYTDVIGFGMLGAAMMFQVMKRKRLAEKQ